MPQFDYTPRDEYDPVKPELLFEHCPQLREANEVRPTPAKHLYLDLYTLDSILDEVTRVTHKSNIPLEDCTKPLKNCTLLLRTAVDRVSSFFDDSPSNSVPDINSLYDTIDLISTDLKRALELSEELISTEHETPPETALTDMHALIERSLTKLGSVLHHVPKSTRSAAQETESDCIDYCTWDNLEDGVEDAEGISITGVCVLCGKEYDAFFQYRGIFDNDLGDYIMQK